MWLIEHQNVERLLWRWWTGKVMHTKPAWKCHRIWKSWISTWTQPTDNYLQHNCSESSRRTVQSRCYTYSYMVQEINSFGGYNDTVKNSSITTKHLYLILTFRSHHEIFIRRSWYSVLPSLDATISCRIKKAVVGMTQLVTALVSIHIARWPSLWVCTASLIHLVGRSCSLSMTVVFFQLIVWLAWFAWSLSADLLYSVRLAVRWLLV